MKNESLQAFFSHYQQRVNHLLSALLPDSEQGSLQKAMRYATLNGGKRIRPILAYATAEVLNAPETHVDRIACALELIHAYSLVHDDLPAMDDDDLRRGNPTCHIKFGDAEAILAGDALQALAFEHLAESAYPAISASEQLQIIRQLAIASGKQGMVAGQSLDLASEGKQISLTELEQIHYAKTGALLEASVTLAAQACGYKDNQGLKQLDIYAQNLGLSFQVQDDILDVTGETHVIGKQAGADQNVNKATYPAILGLEGAQLMAETLHKNAIQALDGFGKKANTLRDIAHFVVSRQY